MATAGNEVACVQVKTGTFPSGRQAPRTGLYRWLAGKRIGRNMGLLILLMPALVYALIFLYRPMVGILIAFKDYKPSLGIMGSPWADSNGLKYFKMFFESYSFSTVVGNTVSLSLYTLVASFPFPLLLALFMNHVANLRFKKTVQTVTYAPHFVSTVVLVGMLNVFLAPSSGIINNMMAALGLPRMMFMNSGAAFPHIYVWSHIWQHTGWDSIIYMAALSGISPELHEAAIVDGATKAQRIRHIDLPGILPTAIILLILNTGHIMTVGFEKAYLMQNSMNSTTSEVLSTYIYKVGLLNAQFSLSTAVGFFNSVINFGMLLIVNSLSRRIAGSSLW